MNQNEFIAMLKLVKIYVNDGLSWNEIEDMLKFNFKEGHFNLPKPKRDIF